MFERFTGEARAAVAQAQEHARRLGHRYIGCEHLLLAAASTAEPASAALREHGVTPERVETEIVRLVGLVRVLARADRLFPLGGQPGVAAIQSTAVGSKDDPIWWPSPTRWSVFVKTHSGGQGRAPTVSATLLAGSGPGGWRLQGQPASFDAGFRKRPSGPLLII